jgi:SAM-dependent methyltransferase
MYNKEYWKKRHAEGYAKSSWRNSPSIFAVFAKTFIPANSKLLELGAGVGQDGIWFAEEGMDVTLTELGEAGLQFARDAIEAKKLTNIRVEQLDMSKPFPYADKSFDVVYAHLSLQYFDEKNTHEIFDEIKRVLKPSGVIAALFNSTSDPEYHNGPVIEDNFFEIKTLTKRYYSVDTLKKYVEDLFNIHILDSKGESYKDAEVGNHGMIRLIANKDIA